ncbi:hypothetical protein G7Z17_g642 [Cylindrodendrum hubeiense]|uniref:Peptidase A2 domain-containing protein n=1 Tax=Cylindrodendrum hubeiense TaxID=595255 RepID=A0A9P5LKT3_9HYPO|nr:hypothetical protein G7Z17_g642 [Cylindrodendrum hubeiense]
MGRVQAMELLLEMKAAVMEKDNRGQTALQLAANAGETDAVKLLVESGSDLGCKSDSGDTPLHFAAVEGHRETVQFLLESSIDVDAANREGRTAVAVAAESGHLEVLQLLFERGADIKIPDSKGLTPLHLAAKSDHNDATQFLIEKGSEIEAKDANGYSSLALAVANRCGSSVEGLAGKGADVFTKVDEASTILHLAASANSIRAARLLVSSGVDINAGDKHGQTALTLAAKNGSIVMVRLLLDSGADPSIVDEHGWSPLHHAAKLGYPVITEILLRKRVDPTLQTTGGDRPIDLATEQNHEDVAEMLQKAVSTWTSEMSEAALVTLFMSAAENGRRNDLSRLLDEGIDPNSSDEAGRKALAAAAAKGQIDAVELLINRGAEVDGIGYDGESALWFAARYGHHETVKYLLSKGASFELADNSDQSPMSAAAQRGHEVVVSTLLSKGSDVNSETSYGKTALFFASQGGYLPVVTVLLDNGAAIDHESKAKLTPLKLARKYRRSKVASFLLERGATEYSDAASSKSRDSSRERSAKTDAEVNNAAESLCNAADDGNVAMVKRHLQIGIAPDSMSADGRVPLGLAAECGNEAAVTALIHAGANVNLSDEDGFTPLCWAAEYGHTAIIRLLASKGADLEAKTKSGTSALLLASEYGQEEAVRQLLSLGADIEFQEIDGLTAFHWAAEYGHSDIILILLDHGADIENTDYSGWTALCHAVHWRHRDVVELLLQKGAAVEPQAPHLASPLCVAARKGHDVIIELLLHYGADPNYLSKASKTPLMLAAAKGRDMAVKILIEAGADFDIRDRDGRTAVSYAKEMNHEVAFQLLSRAAIIKLDNGPRVNTREANTVVSERQYKYEPLGSGALVRVIELHPGTSKDIVSFDLHTVDLSKSPAYEALSYEWGKGQRDIPVECNDGRLRVTRNLMMALKSIRSTTSSRTLWIDALCINQEDMDERSKQVMMMKEIYQKARTVLMWLGPSRKYTKYAWSKIPAFKSAFEVLIQDNCILSSPDEKTTEPVRQILQDVGRRDVKGMKDLCCRRYFTRAWIFQEMVLAGSRGYVLCGDYRCKWDDMKKALAAYEECNEIIDGEYVYIDSYLFVERMFAKRGALEFSQVVDAMKKLHASDPRDKIYAALGLMRESMADLKPDYTLSVQEVFVHTARRIIRAYQSLLFWAPYFHSNIKTLPNLPSWVPDWTVEQEGAEEKGPADAYEINVGVHSSEMGFLIKGDMVTTTTSLFLNGYLMDEVSFGINVKEDEDFYESVVKPTAVNFEASGKSLLDPYLWRDGASCLQVLLLAILSENKCGKTELEEITSFLVWKLTADADLALTMHDVPSDLQSGLRDWDNRSRNQPDFEISICEQMDSRKYGYCDLIYTEKGRFAIANSRTGQEGLVVAILGRLAYPGMLKRCGDSHERWYEYMDAIYFPDFDTAVLDKLENLDKDAEVTRLDIR